MKMRIQGNVIRFRLNRPEVGEFAIGGRVSGSIDFPGGKRLTYGIVKGGDAMVASYEAQEIRVAVPDAVAAEWVGTEQVGLTARVATGGGELEIIIEKDFQCMHKGEAGKDPDAYPNPMAASEPRA